MNEVKELVKALVTNPQARALLDAEKEPASIEEAVEVYADIAAKSGISVKKETIREFLEMNEKAGKAACAKAENAVKEALDEDKLEEVAGGQSPNCKDTYTEGEWCTITDSCAFVIRFYDGAENSPDAGEEDPIRCKSDAVVLGFHDLNDGWVDYEKDCRGSWISSEQ